MESTGVINRIARTMTAAPLDEIERRLCGDQISSPDVGFGSSSAGQLLATKGSGASLKRSTGTSHQVNFLSNVLLKSCAQRRRFTTEQTANLQTALLHLDGVRAQMPTAQQGSIHS